MSDKTIAALWAYDRDAHYPPQFVGAVSEGLRDAWFEESERIRELAEQWFIDFGDDSSDWHFEVFYQALPVPTAALSRDEARLREDVARYEPDLRKLAEDDSSRGQDPS